MRQRNLVRYLYQTYCTIKNPLHRLVYYRFTLAFVSRSEVVVHSNLNTRKQVSNRDEPFMDLSLDVEQNSSVTACLRSFSSTETLTKKNKFFCESCNALQVRHCFCCCWEDTSEGLDFEFCSFRVCVLYLKCPSKGVDIAETMSAILFKQTLAVCALHVPR